VFKTGDSAALQFQLEMLIENEPAKAQCCNHKHADWETAMANDKHADWETAIAQVRSHIRVLEINKRW
jgi:hypothetical protein